MQGIEKMCSLAGAGAGGTAFLDCDRVVELPTIAFTIEGKQFHLSGDDYVLKVRATRSLISSVSACNAPRVSNGRLHFTTQ